MRMNSSRLMSLSQNERACFSEVCLTSAHADLKCEDELNAQEILTSFLTAIFFSRVAACFFLNISAEKCVLSPGTETDPPCEEVWGRHVEGNCTRAYQTLNIFSCLNQAYPTVACGAYGPLTQRQWDHSAIHSVTVQIMTSIRRTQCGCGTGFFPLEN